MRTRATEARTSLHDLEKEAAELGTKLGGSYGKGDAFVSMADRCFETSVSARAHGCVRARVRFCACFAFGICCVCIKAALCGPVCALLLLLLLPLALVLVPALPCATGCTGCTAAGRQVHLRGLPLPQRHAEGGTLLHIAGHLDGPGGGRDRAGLPKWPKLLAGAQSQHDGEWAGG